MTRCLVVADDLTGAMDTGHAFAARGFETVVCLKPTPDVEATVTVVDTDSRYEPPDAATGAVVAAVGDHDGVLYKKVDSTLRGNVAVETAAALEAAPAHLAVVAPAFPASERRTACGLHLVEGDLVTDAPEGNDPEAPVGTSRLPNLFAGVDHPVEHLTVETVARGPTAVGDALSAARRDVDPDAPIVTADAIHDDHLTAIAGGADALDARPLYVGSAGLATHVAVPGGSERRVSIPDSPGEGVLGVVGSTHPRTIEQLDAIPEATVVRLDSARAVHDPDGAADLVAERARRRIETEGRAVIASVGGDAESEAMSAAQEHGIDPAVARRNVADALGVAAECVCEGRPLRGLFLTGGTVARAVLSALDAHGLAVREAAIETGIPLADVRGGVADGASVVTKAGAFGTRETVRESLAVLSG